MSNLREDVRYEIDRYLSTIEGVGWRKATVGDCSVCNEPPNCSVKPDRCNIQLIKPPSVDEVIAQTMDMANPCIDPNIFDGMTYRSGDMAKANKDEILEQLDNIASRTQYTSEQVRQAFRICGDDFKKLHRVLKRDTECYGGSCQFIDAYKEIYGCAEPKGKISPSVKSKDGYTELFIVGTNGITIEYDERMNLLNIRSNDVVLGVATVNEPIKLTVNTNTGNNIYHISKTIMATIMVKNGPVPISDVILLSLKGNIAATARAKGEIPPWPEPPKEVIGAMDRMIGNACLAYRHDFGILSVDARKSVEWDATEWYHAWRKSLEMEQVKT